MWSGEGQPVNAAMMISNAIQLGKGNMASQKAKTLMIHARIDPKLKKSPRASSLRSGYRRPKQFGSS
jgi:hypothetical protein